MVTPGTADEPGEPGATPPDSPSASPVPAGPSPSPSETEPPGSDTEPPRLGRVEFLPPEVADGGEVRVTVNAPDNLSGTVSGSGALISPSGKVFIPFSLSADAASGLLVGSFRVPPEAEAGVWRLSTLRLTDKALNSVVLTPRQDEVARTVSLSVVASRSDTEPPVLESIVLTPPQVEDAGTVSVVVRARDEKSGVAAVRGILESPAKSPQLNFYPRLNPASGAFEGPIRLPQHSQFGEWKVSLLTLTDQAGNRDTIGADDPRLAAARVTVRSSSADAVAPQLVLVQVTPTRVQQGGTVEILVLASDDLSGVRSVDGQGKSLRAPAQFQFVLTQVGPPSGQQVEFRGSTKLPSEAAVGPWRIERMTLADGAGNRTVLTAVSDAALAPAVFEVYQ